MCLVFFSSFSGTREHTYTYTRIKTIIMEILTKTMSMATWKREFVDVDSRLGYEEGLVVLLLLKRILWTPLR